MSLEWELRLRNEVSAAAKQAGLDMRAFMFEVNKAQESIYLLTLAQGKEAKAAGEAKEAHGGLFGDIFKAEILKDGVEELSEKVFDLGKEFVEATIEAADFGYKAEVALKHLTGSAEVTEDVMARARAFANGVGVDVDKATDSFSKLAATGLRGDQLTAAADAAKDLGDANRVSFDQTAALFEMIGSDAGLSGRAVRQLKQFPGLLAEMERHFGFVPGTDKSFQQLTKHLDEAPVKGAEGFALLESEIMKVYHEGAVGNIAVETGLSFEGAFTKIKNDWKEALEDVSKSKEFDELRQDGDALSKFFSPNEAGGRELKKLAEEALGPIVEGAKYLEAHPDALQKFFSEALKDAQALEKVASVLFSIVTFPFKAGEGIGAAISDISNHGRKADADDVHQRMLAEFANNPEAQANLLKPNGARDYGAAPALAPIPSFDDGGDVATTGMAMVHQGERVGPAEKIPASGGGGGHTFHFHVAVEGGGGHDIDEQVLAAKMQEVLPGALINALEQMNQQRGGQ